MTLKRPIYKEFCVVLAEMCEKFSQKPSDYLFNDLECAHTSLAVDMTIFNVWGDWKIEEQEQREKHKRLHNASPK